MAREPSPNLVGPRLWPEVRQDFVERDFEAPCVLQPVWVVPPSRGKYDTRARILNQPVKARQEVTIYLTAPTSARPLQNAVNVEEDHRLTRRGACVRFGAKRCIHRSAVSMIQLAPAIFTAS